MRQRRIFIIALCFVLLFSLGGCGEDPAGMTGDIPEEDVIPVEGDDIEPSDYSTPDNWIATPDPEMPVDVFVLYPTTYSPGEGDIALADITDDSMREGARDFVNDNASAFETAGNIFAPYYRQLDAAFILTKSPQEMGSYTNGVPKEDVEAAFDYYLNNYNEGRPFILVGHSQGATMVKALLFDYFVEHPEVMDRMVASYALGLSVTQAEMEAYPHLRFAEGADDTGVIVSYNTVAPDTDVSELTTWEPGSLAINPITWTRTAETASAEQNLGSWIDSGDGYERVENLADATVNVENGTVVCGSLDEEESELYAMPETVESLFPEGSYHGYDILFYYFNLRENAETRVATFLEMNPEFN